MAEALYRKYRSKRLSEVVGQEHITKTLSNALKAGKISHAYLLTGPRGVGKTSVARILAHEFNNLPYKNDGSHLDIIEIDAASNRRIDEIRDLRDKVHVSPTSAKYKVYIIDEVHMLTKEAFNALLKTLEEPPAHAIFILATTEAHKLPETIVSRTQRFTFRPIDEKEAAKHLKQIAKTEKIDIDDESLELIAQHGFGSFRDSISLLDQLASNKKVRPKDVLNILGVVPEQAVDKLADDLVNGAGRELLDSLDSLKLKGFTAAQIAKQLGEKLRAQLLNKTDGATLNLLKELLRVPSSPEPEQLLELILLEHQLRHSHSIQAPIPEDSIAATPEPAAKDEPKLRPPAPSPVKTDKLSGKVWQDVLSAIKARHNTLYSILRMSEPSFRGKDTLLLTFKFPFHKKQIQEARNMQALKEIVAEKVSPGIKIECQVKGQAAEADAGKDNNKPIETISNIFGSAEVLE